MSPADDSGQILLTRDAGYKLIRSEIKEFEHTTIRAILDKLDEGAAAQSELKGWVKGAVWAIGLIIAGFEAWHAAH